MSKRRLDTLLADRGLFPSRTRAAASVMAGEVHLGTGRRTATKPGELVDDDELIDVDERPAYVSRGGVKLAGALDASGLDRAGRRRSTSGASTGRLHRLSPAERRRAVVAVDVGYGQLAYRLRADPRVAVSSGPTRGP